MRIGLLADSHGRADTTRRAVAALRNNGAELLVHLGDIGGERVIDELTGYPARLVFGNCDDDLPALTRYASFLGILVDHPLGMIEVDGRRVAFTHGHLHALVNQALAQGVDYLLHGHSHEVRDQRIGPTRVINPGALCRAPRYTAAVLDPVADVLQIIELPRT
ncbi:MAG: YfcE family phosphodiesterase [Phycisphaerales bacterium]|nr:YfcE family phosphodiesterase [Phycisphaerales bacterium]MCI0631762.1 YfcE family phosphodiesterase [Phycisphaerales bacterium]MCI0677383.1 YfcE family phosphodiesterase [Phycisphaerales bacterium]